MAFRPPSPAFCSSMIFSENRYTLFRIMLWSRVITIRSRRTQGALLHPENEHLPAKILVQQAEQQMVLPDAVDAEIAPREPLAGKAAFLQHPDRRRIRRDTGRLDPVQIELAEQGRQQNAQRRGHVAAMGMWLSDPIADGARLHDA